MCKAFCGSNGTLGPVKSKLLNVYKCLRSSTVCPPLCRPPRCSVPRPLWERRCRRDTGPILRREARAKESSSSVEASARIELLSAARVLAGSAPKNACFDGTSVNPFCAASRLPLPPPRSRQRCLYVSLWAVDVGRRLQPLATRPKHTHHRSVRIDAPILPCLRDGSQKYSRHAPRAGNLRARGKPLVVRACER